MRQTCNTDGGAGSTENVQARDITHLSIFVDTPTAAPNPETKLLADFKKDTHLSKVYLAGREYLNKEGQTSVRPLIGKIMQQIGTDPTLCPEYPSSFGLPEFTRRATELVLGRDCHAIVENRVLGVQTVGCTGAVRLGAELLKHWYNVSGVWCGPIYLSSPCDDSLAGIFEAAGIQDVRRYRYWDTEQRGVCVQKMMEDLEMAPEQSVIVLSASAHCPTGSDLSQKHWRLLTQFMVRCRFFPFFLLPAQGLCHGDLEQDAWPVRLCASLGMELLCAQSFSHSFGLYGERVGHLLCVLKQSSTLLAVQSQAEKLVRALWSRPSVGGARVVATVLSNPAHHVECPTSGIPEKEESYLPASQWLSECECYQQP
ncbi:putative aspartate aminotransferase, cytoplasmic 2 isoform X2 [Coregonus clupeaformis]|uniref:putative aspartate aminotransferase, cytoplasmic 2 isoform X2 n=1 Tax=Coregonus clupeaformis TaxID=59861 RepID=UPI001BE0334A|nr:putative aspartate aminotransferase, cytoplasmic 2 isoform X2 [Coregonus clupeaformis]